MEEINQDENKTESNDKKESWFRRNKYLVIISLVFLFGFVSGFYFYTNPETSITSLFSAGLVSSISSNSYQGITQTSSININTIPNTNNWKFKKIDGIQKSNFTWTINNSYLCVSPIGSMKVSVAGQYLTRSTKQNNTIIKALNQTDYILTTSGGGANTLLIRACLPINSSAWNYIKIGNQSIEASNNPSQQINIDENGANITCGIEKKIVNNWNSIETLWVSGTEWGLNDQYNSGTNESYRITCNSILPYENINNSQYLYGVAIHDFSKTCQPENGCVFEDINSTSMRVTLNSTGYIDPTYTIPVVLNGALTYNATIEPNNCTNLNIDTSQTPYGNLVGYWNFDCNDMGSSGVRDMTSNNYDGTYTNGAYPTQTSAKYESAGAFFDGSNDYVATLGSTSTTQFVQNTMNFTISAWLKLNNNSARQYFISSSSTTTEKVFFLMYETYDTTYGNKTIRMRIDKGTSSNWVADVRMNNSVLTDTNWHHVVAVGNGTDIIFYLDNVLQTTNLIVPYNLTLPTGASSRALALGIGISSLNLPLNGSLDEIMI